MSSDVEKGSSVCEEPTKPPSSASDPNEDHNDIVGEAHDKNNKTKKASRSKRNSMRRRDVGVASPIEAKPIRPPPGLTPKAQLPPSMLDGENKPKTLKYTIDQLLNMQDHKHCKVRPPNLPPSIDNSLLDRNSFDDRSHKNSWGNDDRPRRLFPERPDAGYQPSTRERDKDDRDRDPRDKDRDRGSPPNEALRDSSYSRFPPSSSDSPRFPGNGERTPTSRFGGGWHTPKSSWRDRQRRDEAGDRGRDHRDEREDYIYRNNYRHTPRDRDEYPYREREAYGYRDPERERLRDRERERDRDFRDRDGDMRDGRERATTPRGDSRDTPRGDSRDTPRGDSRDAPRGDSRDAPRGDSRDTPRGDSRDTPRGDSRDTPRGDSRDAPRGDSRDTPRDWDSFRDFRDSRDRPTNDRDYNTSRYRGRGNYYRDDDRHDGRDFSPRGRSPPRGHSPRGSSPRRRYSPRRYHEDSPLWFDEEIADRPFSLQDCVLDREADLAHMEKYGYLPARGRRIDKSQRRAENESDGEQDRSQERTSSITPRPPGSHKDSAEFSPKHSSNSSRKASPSPERDRERETETVDLQGEVDKQDKSSPKTVLVVEETSKLGVDSPVPRVSLVEEDGPGVKEDVKPEAQGEAEKESQPAAQPQEVTSSGEQQSLVSLADQLEDDEPFSFDPKASRSISENSFPSKSPSVWSDKPSKLTDKMSGELLEVDSLFSEGSKHLDEYMKQFTQSQDSGGEDNNEPTTNFENSLSSMLSFDSPKLHPSSSPPPATSRKSIPASSPREKHRFGIELEDSPQMKNMQPPFSTSSLRLDERVVHNSSASAISSQSESFLSNQPPMANNTRSPMPGLSLPGSTMTNSNSSVASRPAPIQTPQEVGFDEASDLYRLASNHNGFNESSKRTVSRFGFELDDSPPKHVENSHAAAQVHAKQLDTFSLDGARLGDQQRSRLLHQQRTFPNGFANLQEMNNVGLGGLGGLNYSVASGGRSRAPQSSPKVRQAPTGGGLPARIPEYDDYGISERLHLHAAEMDARMQQNQAPTSAGMHINPLTVQQLQHQQHHQPQQQQHQHQPRHSDHDFQSHSLPHSRNQIRTAAGGGLYDGIMSQQAASQQSVGGLSHIPHNQMSEGELFKMLERNEPPPLPSLDHLPSDFATLSSNQNTILHLPQQPQPQQSQQHRQQSHPHPGQLDSGAIVYQQVIARQRAHTMNVPPHIIHTQARTPRDGSSSTPMYVPHNFTQAPPQPQYSHMTSVGTVSVNTPGGLSSHHQQPTQHSQYHPPPNLPHPVYTSTAPSPTSHSHHSFVPQATAGGSGVSTPSLPGHMASRGGTTTSLAAARQHIDQQQHPHQQHQQRQQEFGLYSIRNSGFQQDKVQGVAPPMQGVPRTYFSGDMERKFGSLPMQ